MADYDDQFSVPPEDRGSPGDAQAPLAPLPEPFDEQPKQVVGGGRGCGKVALIGCGVLLLLFGIAAAVFVVKANDMLVWLLSKLESQIEAGLPEDLEPAERERFDRAFTDLYDAIESGDMDPFAVQDLQRKLLELSEDVERGLTREQTLELIEAVEKAAGTAPEDEPADEGGGEMPVDEESPPAEEQPEDAAPSDGDEGGSDAEATVESPIAA